MAMEVLIGFMFLWNAQAAACLSKGTHKVMSALPLALCSCEDQQPCPKGIVPIQRIMEFHWVNRAG